MGTADPRTIYYGNKFYVPRWVWEANRGKPIGEMATFALLADGNLVITEADGRVAWETKTANKDVVGFELLPNGNMVLYNSKGAYVWQSFDTPTDTLLVGQGLRLGGMTKLVSRASERDNSNGPYSFVMDNDTMVLYYTSPTSGKRYAYYSFTDRFNTLTGALESVTFQCAPQTEENYAYNLYLNYTVTDKSFFGSPVLVRPNWNVTYSMLRLGIDGSLKIFTYYEPVERTKWEVTYTLFSEEYAGGCQLPEKCGKFGLCESGMCVGCPAETGATAWSSSCQPKTVSALACANKAFKFNKLVSVDHFMSAFTQGENVSESACGSQCTSDCKCAGYFYHQADSKCWVAYDLKTLTRNGNSTHIGYIKVPK
uniref:Bulb-type lectin domain-containing protein n=1 Tax=Kalanchoe fedtschenkoi TaxID=63787 RepID=A0A7N0V6H8_KALFE